MSVLGKDGYLEGALNIYALWYDPSVGGDGRMAAVLRYKNGFYVADITCGWKFWSGRNDSLRQGWELNATAEALLQTALERAIKKCKSADELRMMVRAQKKGGTELLPYMTLISTSGVVAPKPLNAYRIWPNGHTGHWHANIGHAQNAMDLFPQAKFVPKEVQALIKKLGAKWPSEHITAADAKSQKVKTALAKLTPADRVALGV